MQPYDSLIAGKDFPTASEDKFLRANSYHEKP
jgi:hypothetical protein